MDPNFYRFETQWELAAPPDDTYLALAELDDYPTWWPEVRSVRRLDGTTRQLTCRSVLPYDLVFLSRPLRQNPTARILEASLTGDLTGFSCWSLLPSAHGTCATFEEEVTANKTLLRRLALIARPAFRANHTLMMNHGKRGLTTYLAGLALGRVNARRGS